MNKIIAYLAVWLFGLLFIIGLSALIFETAIMVRLIGLVVVLASIIFGNLVAKKHWPNKNETVKDSDV